MTDESPMDALIRRADAYAAYEYYGPGLRECQEDNRALASEARNQILREAAQFLYDYPTYTGLMKLAGDIINPDIDNLPYCTRQHHSHPARECPEGPQT